MYINKILLSIQNMQLMSRYNYMMKYNYIMKSWISDSFVKYNLLANRCGASAICKLLTQSL